MKTAITIVAVVLIALGSATALATDKEFNQTEGFWHVPGNWTPSGKPVDGDTVTILDGQLCKIFDSTQHSDEACDWIDVQSGGELWIKKNATLTIDEDSTVDGTLTIGDGSSAHAEALLIARHVTIEGDGGEIVMNGSSIDDAGGFAYILTIQSSDEECPDGDQSCSLVVRGGNGDIKVKLTNDAYVIPDGSDIECGGTHLPITLSEHAKNGSGVWGASEAGHLKVDVELTGSGTWQMIDEDSQCAWRAKITINHCTAVSGDVNLEHGTFVVDERFCTGGDLTWKSESDPSPSGFSTPIIDVKAVTLARFGVLVCQTCP